MQYNYHYIPVPKFQEKKLTVTTKLFFVIIVFPGRHFNKFLSRMFCLLSSDGWNIADMTYNTKESVWTKLAEWILRVVNLFWLLSLPEGGHDPLLSALTNNLYQVEIDLNYHMGESWSPLRTRKRNSLLTQNSVPIPKHVFVKFDPVVQNVKGLQADRQTVHNQGLLICISFQLRWP